MPHIPGYNFAGPGTDLVKQLKEGKFPVDDLDLASLIHDAQYSDNTFSTEEADQIYLDTLDKIQQTPQSALATLAFKGKQFVDKLTNSATDYLIRPERVAYQGKYATCT